MEGTWGDQPRSFPQTAFVQPQGLLPNLRVRRPPGRHCEHPQLFLRPPGALRARPDCSLRLAGAALPTAAGGQTVVLALSEAVLGTAVVALGLAWPWQACLPGLVTQQRCGPSAGGSPLAPGADTDAASPGGRQGTPAAVGDRSGRQWHGCHDGRGTTTVADPEQREMAFSESRRRRLVTRGWSVEGARIPMEWAGAEWKESGFMPVATVLPTEAGVGGRGSP